MPRGGFLSNTFNLVKTVEKARANQLISDTKLAQEQLTSAEDYNAMNAQTDGTKKLQAGTKLAEDDAQQPLELEAVEPKQTHTAKSSIQAQTQDASMQEAIPQRRVRAPDAEFAHLTPSSRT